MLQVVVIWVTPSPLILQNRVVAFLAPSKLAITVPLGGWENKTTPKPVEKDISTCQNHMHSYVATMILSWLKILMSIVMVNFVIRYLYQDRLATDCRMYDSMAVIDYHCWYTWVVYVFFWHSMVGGTIDIYGGTPLQFTTLESDFSETIQVHWLL